ncbi:MAG: ATP-binding cassette domain-containing protein [Clostridia bacterium]|nr:ATP-binding cassette domain-containing protein [Clostridia bacterium]
MLQIQHLTIVHTKDLRTILEDFSCTLNAGDKAVIIGEEGNGKSTLLKWIADPALIEDYAEADGILSAARERLAYLPQQLSLQDAERTVYEFFCEEPLFFDTPPGKLAKETARLGLSADICYSDQRMGSLSGGEKVKVQLLRLLISQPTVLLLDEPSNDIDIGALEYLERVILGFPGIVLFISHDETLIERTAGVVIHLEQVHRKQQCRHTVARMPYAQYARERLNAFEKQAQQAASDARDKRIRDEKYRRILQSVARAQVTINHAGKDMPDPMQAARNLKDKMHTVKSLKKRFEREDAQMTEKPVKENPIDFTLGENAQPIPAGKTVLDFALPQLKAPDSRLLASDIRLLVRGPEKVCIIGPNGCGKTTLLRAVWEQLKVRTDIRAAYMPQNYADLLDLEQNPVDCICTKGGAEERTMVRTFLGALRFTTAEMEHPAKELSGGQQAKIFLLRLNLSGANALLLDEPTRNFSPLSGPVIRGMLAGFPGAVISVSHDRKYIEEVCGTVFELTEQGLLKRR